MLVLLVKLLMNRGILDSKYSIESSPSWKHSSPKLIKMDTFENVESAYRVILSLIEATVKMYY
jgi:hypothetical protein